MTSNTIRPTKQKNGAPLHKAQLEKLQEDHSQLQQNHDSLARRNNALSETISTQALIIDTQNRTARHKEGLLKEAEHMNKQLSIEACMSVANREDMKHYRKCARYWCAGAVIMLIGLIVFAVTL